MAANDQQNDSRSPYNNGSFKPNQINTNQTLQNTYSNSNIGLKSSRQY